MHCYIVKLLTQKTNSLLCRLIGFLAFFSFLCFFGFFAFFTFLCIFAFVRLFFLLRVILFFGRLVVILFLFAFIWLRGLLLFFLLIITFSRRKLLDFWLARCLVTLLPHLGELSVKFDNLVVELFRALLQ